MKKINALHLASFNGNIGDNANHYGFYKCLSTLPFLFSFTKLEIRDFYTKKRFFDESFVSYVNTFDLLIVGGGNYFELWVDHSPTGTSFMIEPDLFSNIKVPVLFNSLGVDLGQGTTENNISKFHKFIEVVLSNKKNLLSVRNDGSYQNLVKCYGEKFASNFIKTSDSGIFIDIDPSFTIPVFKKKFVCINIAGDMLDTRFNSISPSAFTEDTFCYSFAKYIEWLVHDMLIEEVVFMPHIIADLPIFYKISEFLSATIRRQSLSFAPLLQGQDSEKVFFSYYYHSSLNICNRFHANLCSVGLSKPTIMLYNYSQIKNLADETSLTDYLLDITKADSFQGIYSLTHQLLDNKKFNKSFNYASEQAKSLYTDFTESLLNWLTMNFEMS